MSKQTKKFNEVFNKIEMPNKTRQTLENINIGNVEFRASEKLLNIQATSLEILEEEHIFEFERQVKKQLNFISNINFELKYECDSVIENVFELYWKNLLTAVMYKSNYWYTVLKNSFYTLKDDVIEVSIEKRFSYVLQKDDMKNFLQDFTVNKFKKDLQFEFKIVGSKGVNVSDEELHEYVTLPKEELGIIASLKDDTPTQVQHGKKDFKKFKGRTGNLSVTELYPEDVVSIADNIEPEKEVVVLGEIVSVEEKPIKNDKIIVTFDICDATSAVTVKFFANQADYNESIKPCIKKGKGIIVKGRVVHDDYAREMLIMATEICPSELDKSVVEDNEEVKRVELHLHTNMSASDGINSIKSIIGKAKAMGHKAVAITDHGVVQAFPDAMGAVKGTDIKVIYGVEAYFVDDTQYIVKASRNQTLDDTYVVFDIETTGFHNNVHTIIEIGAVKIKGGKVIDTFSELIDPKEKLPEHIIELTKITDDMLEGKPTLDIVLPKFLEFIKDTVLVAQNAKFDVNFINKFSKDILGKDIDNTVVDTVSMAHLLLPELNKFKLNIVAEYLSIELKSHHRAVDDANATAEIFLEFSRRFKDLGLNTLDEINLYAQEHYPLKRARPHHLIILTKTQAGLRNLYELISEAHIKNLRRKAPITLKSNLLRLKEGLIIGAACEAGEFYGAVLQNTPQNQIDQIAELYDYLEIQPPYNKEYLVRNGEINSIEVIHEIDKKIIQLGDKYNKPVVATCDVHFLNKEDEIFRRIVMDSKGFKDADQQAPLYYRTTREMLDEFYYLGDETAYEVVVKNTNLIADMIEDVLPVPKGTFPPRMENADEDIRKICYDRAHEVYGEVLPEIVEKRLERELGSIIKNGFSVMYIIAQKLVWNSLENGYLVGSRGSVGSSFVATMLQITEVNPLQPHYLCENCKYTDFTSDTVIEYLGSSGVDMPDKDCPVCGQKLSKDGHDIPFETFLGFDGDKEPDIDLNFSGEYQAKAHAYTEELFGEGYVFKAGTIGTIADKTAYGMVRKYYEARGKTLRNAEINRVKDGCVGIKRTSGQHPGGLMVVPSYKSIYDFCPVQRPADDETSDVKTTHFDYHSISGRLLKLDILGHDVPTILKMLEDMTGTDPTKIDLGDKDIMALFNSPEIMGVTEEDIMCNTGSLGLPEFGTNFVRTMLKDTQPNTFSELVRISGLSHGADVWLNNGQDLVRDGVASLKEIIPTRDDIMVYLIIKGVDNLQAFTIMESVRKGKGMTEEQEALLVKHDVPQWYIDSCKKISYMFPKGHAVAYVMMTVRIGYYKIHYPEAFYAAMLSMKAEDIDYETMCQGKEKAKETLLALKKLGNDATAKDKSKISVLELIYEMYARGYNFVPIDIYKAKSDKFILVDGGLMPPLATIPGLGGNAAIALVESREDGEFYNIEDLRERTKITKTVIQIMKDNNLLNGMPETNQLSLFNMM